QPPSRTVRADGSIAVARHETRRRELLREVRESFRLRIRPLRRLPQFESKDCFLNRAGHPTEAYLRAAQAYMLISMPTDTSTIFGVFQAIAGLLPIGTIFLPHDKLIQFKKFASDYFAIASDVFILQCKTKRPAPRRASGKI